MPYAREVLKYRGLLNVFDEIYGIEDATYVPKPFPEAFEIIFSNVEMAGCNRHLDLTIKVRLSTILCDLLSANLL